MFFTVVKNLLTKNRTMKLSFLLFALVLFNVQANSYSQNKKISLEITNGSVVSVLKKIEAESKFKFFYKTGVIDVKRRVSINVTDRSIKNILDILFKGENVSYSLVKKQIVLKRKAALSKALKTDKVQNLNIPIIQYSVSGKITDSQGAPLPGASIVEKGTNNGVTSDFDGNFSLEVSDDNVVLVISYIGFATVEVPLNGQTEVEVVLKESAASLDEVVLLGYGSVKKADLTGAVARADLESFRDQANPNILQSLQGTVPGLNVGRTTTAGESPNISVRGQTGLLAANSSPLIILDGIIYRGNLLDINPDDIASVDVLKDASSTAIYGSQAANGVIVISSKKGRTEEPLFNFTTRLSVRTDANPLEYYDAGGYLQTIRDFNWQDSRMGPDFVTPNPNFDPSDELTPIEFPNFEDGSNVIWRDLITRQGMLQNHNLSISGRSEKVTYTLSGSYLGQEEVFKGDDYEKITGRVNLETKLLDWLTIGTNSFVTTADFSGIEFSTVVGSTFSPFAEPFDEAGIPILNPNGQIPTNPFLLADDEDFDKRLHLNSLIYAKITMPWIKGLTYQLNYGNSYRTERQNRFSFTANNNAGSAFKIFNVFYDWTLDNIFSYSNTIGDKHRFDATLVFGREERSGEGTEARGDNFAIQTLGFNSLQNADLEFINSSAFDESSIYTMARLNYVYNNKYILTGTIRRDGFSGFGSENKTAVFPSFAFGWTASEESFLRDWAPLTNLKLRGSYGISGNRGLERYGTLARVGIRDGYVFGDGGSTLLAQNLLSFAAPNLKWETTTGINLGLDFSLFNNRLSGSIDYYNTRTEDILFLKPLPLISGLSGINANIGEVKNRGFEAIISSVNINTDNFRWNTQFNLSRNVNEVVSVLGTDLDGDGIEDNIEDAGLFIGESIGTVFDYEVEGIYQIGDTDIPDGFEPGFLRIKDQDGNGEINSLDRTIIGYQEPAYQFGINNELVYKNFNLIFFINSIQGGKDGYLGNNTPYNITGWIDRSLGRVESNRPVIWDYWTPENPNAEYPSLRYQTSAEPRIFKSRSFVRLQDVNLSYRFNEKLVDKIGLKNLSLFIGGRNLITWTNWKGLDPETAEGITYGRPLIRSYNLGINLSF